MHAVIVYIAWIVFAAVAGLLPIALLLWIGYLPVRVWDKWRR